MSFVSFSERVFSLFYSNTYTNKTWSEVSGIDLEEINRMEREFLVGVDFNLYVDKSTYESWLNLLKGLIMAKERDSKHLRKSRGLAHQSRLAATYPSSTGPATRAYVSSSRQKPPVYRHRARSTSPTSRTLSYPQPSHNYVSHPEPLPSLPASSMPYTSSNTSQYISAATASPTPRSGSKRTAQDAFSPTSASFSQLPNKRPVSMSLQIPEFRQTLSSGSTSSHSSSPLEGLQSFSKMSINTNHSPIETSSPWAENGTGIDRVPTTATPARNTVPETLVTAYLMDEEKKSTAPQVGFSLKHFQLGVINNNISSLQALYFYKLTSSPLYNASVSEESRPRKAVLRYHQPTSSTSSSSYSYGDMNAAPNGPLYNSSASRESQFANSYGGPAARFLQQPQAVMMPAVVQSASTSPAMAIDVDCGHLPHFHDDIWARPPAAPVSRVSQHIRSQQQQQQSSTECDSPVDASHGYNRYGHPEQQHADSRIYATQQTDQQMDYAPPHATYSSPTVVSSGSPYYHHRQQHVPSAAPRAAPVTVAAPAQGQGQMQVSVPSAPFANAGPPGVGVQFYPNPSQSSSYPSPLPHPYGYTCPYNPRQGGHASWMRMRNGVGC